MQPHLKALAGGQLSAALEGVRARLIGTLLDGKYQITRLLGRELNADVYLAHEEANNRLVSIKVLLSSQAQDPALFALVIGDGQRAKELKHPALITFDDHGHLENGLPYVVVDYLRDVSLGDLINKKQLTVKRTLSLFIQLCDAMSYAHERQVIHGDLRPTNIMVVTDGNGDNVRVVDFGLDKLGARQNERSVDNVVFYRCPELFSPSLENKQPDMDVYSLGCILYEALTGQPPFQGTIEQIKQKHHKAVPPYMELLDQPVAVRRKINEILLRSMAKSPQFRYRTAGELRDELQVAKDQLQDGYLKYVVRFIQSAASLRQHHRKR